MSCSTSKSDEEIVPLPTSRGERQRLPEWIRRESRMSEKTRELRSLLRQKKLHTVCEEARCPNISECFSRGTATFMILGDICTRGCRFCSVVTGKPIMPVSDFDSEAQRVKEAVSTLGLRYVVITSVARDDLADGGAEGFAKTIRAIKSELPEVKVEVLIPDLRGNWSALYKIVDEEPFVLNHNIETVPRLYRRVRPGASMQRSLELLREAKERNNAVSTKTGIMLGLGESIEEIKEVMELSSSFGVDIFTAGQYMQPSKNHLPVEAYIEPSVFDALSAYAKERKLFKEVYMGPLVRSSYHAGEVAQRLESAAT